MEADCKLIKMMDYNGTDGPEVRSIPVSRSCADPALLFPVRSKYVRHVTCPFSPRGENDEMMKNQK